MGMGREAGDPDDRSRLGRLSRRGALRHGLVRDRVLLGSSRSQTGRAGHVEDGHLELRGRGDDVEPAPHRTTGWDRDLRCERVAYPSTGISAQELGNGTVSSNTNMA